MVPAEPQSDWEVHGLLHLAGLRAGCRFGHSPQQLGERGTGHAESPSGCLLPRSKSSYSIAVLPYAGLYVAVERYTLALLNELVQMKI